MPIPGAILALGGSGQLFTGIGNLVGIKGSFKSGVDWGSGEWLNFHRSVSGLKYEDGSLYGDRPTIGEAYRFLKGDYPQPDRDASDRKNRENMQRAAQEIERIALLPINVGGGNVEVEAKLNVLKNMGEKTAADAADKAAGFLSNFVDKIFGKTATDAGAAAGKATADKIIPFVAVAGLAIVGILLLRR